MEIPLMSDKDYDALAKTLATQGSLALHEHHPELEHLRIALTWHSNGFEQQKLALDLAAVLLTATGQARGPDDLIFYNQPTSSCGSVKYSRAAATNHAHHAEILIRLSALPPEISRIALLASVHRAAERQQNFGLVRAAQVTLYNASRSNSYITSLDLTEELSLSRAAVVGELQRRTAGKHQDWHYIRMGMGDEGGLENLLLDYGLQTTTPFGGTT